MIEQAQRRREEPDWVHWNTDVEETARKKSVSIRGVWVGVGGGPHRGRRTLVCTVMSPLSLILCGGGGGGMAREPSLASPWARPLSHHSLMMAS